MFAQVVVEKRNSSKVMLWMEAEAGSITLPMKVFDNNDASGGQFVEGQGGNNNAENAPEDGQITYKFTINNEPDIACPYLFRHVKGEEHRTDELVHKIINENFGTDHNGLPGNDDCGTISAWFIFSAMGFYPDCPADNYYAFGFPLFDKVTISLNPNYYNSGEIVIERKTGTDRTGIYLNNNEIINYRLYHDQHTKGGILLFK